MKQAEKYRAGTCVYCGSVGTVTRDHVPPKSFFSTPRPSNLVTVPACRNCHNAETSRDDEYFRLVLHVREDLYDHPDIVKMRGAIFRSFEKTKKIGMFKGLLQTVQPVDMATPGGIFLRSQLGFTVDMNRLHRVVKRMVKAFYFHEKRCRVPATHDAFAVSEDTVKNWPEESQAEVLRTIIRPLLTHAPKTLGDSVFTYRYAFDEKDPYSSAWLFVFYGRARFCGVTLPKKLSYQIPEALR